MTNNFRHPRARRTGPWPVRGEPIPRSVIDQIVALINPTGQSQRITEINITAGFLDVTRLEPGAGLVCETRKIE